jgi:sulfur relay (sulfurtransferase) DsrF/TusC family protein
MNPKVQESKELHQKAIEAYGEALYYHRSDDPQKHDKVIEYAFKALMAEIQAVLILDNQPELIHTKPTQAILYRSAASIALLLGKYGEELGYIMAQELIKRGLVLTEDPVIRLELQDMEQLLAKIIEKDKNIQNHIELHKLFQMMPAG